MIILLLVKKALNLKKKTFIKIQSLKNLEIESFCRLPLFWKGRHLLCKIGLSFRLGIGFEIREEGLIGEIFLIGKDLLLRLLRVGLGCWRGFQLLRGLFRRSHRRLLKGWTYFIIGIEKGIFGFMVF